MTPPTEHEKQWLRNIVGCNYSDRDLRLPVNVWRLPLVDALERSEYTIERCRNKAAYAAVVAAGAAAVVAAAVAVAAASTVAVTVKVTVVAVSTKKLRPR